MEDGPASPVQTRRIDWIWLALPYALVLFSSALTTSAGDLADAEVPWAVATSVVVLGWHTWWTVLHRDWLETAVLPMAVYYVGLLSLTALLFHLSFNFFPLYLVCFAMAFVALPGLWAYAGVALTTAVALLGPGLLNWSTQNVVVTLAGGTLAAAAGWSIRALESETRQRRAAMAELARTQRTLEESLAQNEALRDRLVAEAREAGVATERARLAGEIHDTIASGLVAVVSQLEVADAQLGPAHAVTERVRVACSVARETLHEARRSVRALRPRQLDDAPLHDALRQVVRQVGRPGAPPVSLHVSGVPLPLPEAVEDTLLRAAQEALTNIGRHARASTAHLTLSYLGESVALDVVDDGAGFDPGVRQADGHGLTIMADRAAALGGRVELDSAPGRGTTLTVTVPLTTEDEAG